MATRRRFLAGSLLLAQAAVPAPATAQAPSQARPEAGSEPLSEPGTFRQAGDGAVPRPLEDKVRETISVEDFYQRTSQDATAWLRAWDRIRAQGGGVLHCARTRYFFDRQVTLNTAGFTGPVVIAGQGAVIRTQGPISALRLEGSSSPYAKRICDLAVLHNGNREAIAGFEQVGASNITWDGCSVVADQAVPAGYGGFLLRQRNPDDDQSGGYWTRFPGSAVRSTGGITVPNGVILDGSMNAVSMDGLSLQGVINGVLMRHAVGTHMAPARRGSTNSVRVQGAWIEGARNAVRFEGVPGGYGPHSLTIDSRIEACEVLLSLQGATLNHALPPLIHLQEAISITRVLVENPNNLLVSIIDRRCWGGGPSTQVNGGGWRFATVNAANDVLALDCPNSGGGLVMTVAGQEVASFRPVNPGGLHIAELAGAPRAPLSVRGLRGLSSTQARANNIKGAVALAAGRGQVTFAHPEPDAAYEVWLQPDAHETLRPVAKTATGFQIQSSNPASRARAAWLLVR